MTDVHIVLRLTRDDEPPPRVTVQEVMDELENEIEANGIEVNSAVYSIQVVGIGKTRAELDESLKRRRDLYR